MRIFKYFSDDSKRCPDLDGYPVQHSMDFLKNKQLYFGSLNEFDDTREGLFYYDDEIWLSDFEGSEFEKFQIGNPVYRFDKKNFGKYSNSTQFNSHYKSFLIENYGG